MPIYEYELCDGKCDKCGGKFAIQRAASAAALTACPSCQKPVRKLFSTFSSPNIGVSISKANDTGFTVLKRISKGEYEVHSPKKNG